MALENALLCKLTRLQTGAPTTLKNRDELNAVDGPVFSIFEQAKQQLNRSAAKRFGFFDEESDDKQWMGLLKNWLDESLGFLEFAKRTASAMQNPFDCTETPFEASLLIAEESLLGNRYCYIFWIPMVQSLQLDGELEPTTTQTLEPGKLQFAIRLDLDDWQSGDSPKYLTCYASKGDKDLSDAFKRFTCFKEGIDISKQTQEFLTIVDDYTEEMPEEQATSVKTSILDYCVDQDKVGSPVVIADLSEQLSAESPKAFAEYVSGAQQEPLSEIHTDRSSLKRYMRYFGRDHSLSISFNAERFGKDITYDPVSGNLKIAKLPKNLKTQLSGFAEKA